MKKLLIIIGILSLSIVYQAQYSEKEHAFSLQFNAISPFQKSIEIQAEAMLSPRFGLGFAFANSYGNHFDYDYRLKGFFRTYTWDSEQKIGLFAEIASTIPMYDRYSNYDSEPLFGVGAGVVIIGALLKIINGSLIFSANTWLIVGLSVEAGIFVLSGIQGFLLGKKDEEDDVVSTIAVETAELQKAVDGTVKGLSELNSNISNASVATASIKVPTDMGKNTEDFNKGLASASSNIQEVAKVLNNLKETVEAFENVNMPEGLGDEMQKMKNTVKELNAKYEAMLGAMNK